jgi:hypothetical protein
MDKDDQTLSEKEEILLAKYFDDECNFFERYRVYHLVETRPAAIAYLETLEATRRVLKDNFEFAPVSLWSRISVRLHQEDSAQHRLARGRGFGASLVHVLFDAIPSYARYGLAGATLAFALFIFLPQQQAGSLSKVLPQASMFSSRGSSSRIPTAVEVDWMRSNSNRRVTLMPSDQGRAPVIYVKRRPNRTAPVPILERNSQGIIMRDR